ncbi:MAG: hypothetical protein ACKO04_10955 [Actinomycetes bacterium]
MTDAPPASRRPLPDWARRTIMLVLVGGALTGLFLTARAAVTGSDPTSDALPEAVLQLIPAPDSEVLAQSQVGIRFQPGYDGYLVVNGTEVRTSTDGLRKDLGSGIIDFQPGPNTVVPSLNPERNCVTAVIWKQVEGPTASRPVPWCFNAA